MRFYVIYVVCLLFQVPILMQGYPHKDWRLWLGIAGIICILVMIVNSIRIDVRHRRLMKSLSGWK